MQSGYQTDEQVMTAAAGRVDAVNASVQSRLQSLESEIKSATKGWQGPAGSMFQQLMVSYNDDAVKLSKALTNIATEMRNQAKGYGTAQEQTQQALSQIKSALSS